MFIYVALKDPLEFWNVKNIYNEPTNIKYKYFTPQNKTDNIRWICLLYFLIAWYVLCVLKIFKFSTEQILVDKVQTEKLLMSLLSLGLYYSFHEGRIKWYYSITVQCSVIQVLKFWVLGHSYYISRYYLSYIPVNTALIS